MSTANEKLKYIVYCRKSSEDKDRQVISIESQERELLDHAKRNGLHIHGIYREEKSAHKRGRPVFADVMRLLENGTANAFLVWHPNRIARNMADAGTVISFMDEGKIKEVRTPFSVFQNTPDNKFVLLIEFGMAKKSSDELVPNVKRGHRTKNLMGIRNGIAPIGYLNNLDKPKGERNIIPDPERFDLIGRILRFFLAGEYSVRQLQREAITWGLKTRVTKKQGGRHLPISAIYKILTEPFYAGWFWVKDEQIGERKLQKGAHEPMITLEEFDLIQEKLGRKGRPRPRENRHFPYTGKCECGECGSMVTAEEKNQMICTSCKLKFAYRGKNACPECNTKIKAMRKPTILQYTYYHCTKTKNKNCSQRSVRVEVLESMFDQALKEFKLSPEFTQWALEELETDTDQAIHSQTAVVDSQQQRYKNVVTELLNLTKLYTSAANVDGKHQSLEEYGLQRDALLAEKKALEEAQQATGRKIEEWIDFAENSFNFAVAARVWFENGTPEQKRAIFMSISGSNLILQDGKLGISLKQPLDFYSAIVSRYPSTTIPFEPTKSGSNKRKRLPFEADIPGIREILNDVRTYFQVVKVYTPFPDFSTPVAPVGR